MASKYDIALQDTIIIHAERDGILHEIRRCKTLVEDIVELLDGLCYLQYDIKGIRIELKGNTITETYKLGNLTVRVKP